MTTAIRYHGDRRDYRLMLNFAILGNDIIYPLCGLTGNTAFFEAFDAHSDVMVIGKYVDMVTPEVVTEVTELARGASKNDADTEIVGALIVPPTGVLTDAGEELCKDIVVYQFRLINGEPRLQRINS